MNNYKFLLASIMALALVTKAFASSADDDGTGYYVGLNAGYAARHMSENSFFQSMAGQTVTNKRDKGPAGNINFGYIFSPNFALETGFSYLPAAKANIAVSNHAATVESLGYLVNFLFRSSIEFQHGILAYINLGMAYGDIVMKYTGEANSTAKGFYPTFGLGLTYALNHRLALNAGWQRLIGNSNGFNAYAQAQQVGKGGAFNKLPNLDLFMLGISYRF